MACPFVRVDSTTLAKQQTVDYIEDELNDAPGDALTLSNLNSAIQLLTGPSVKRRTLNSNHLYTY